MCVACACAAQPQHAEHGTVCVMAVSFYLSFGFMQQRCSMASECRGVTTPLRLYQGCKIASVAEQPKRVLILCWCLTCQIFFAAVGAAGSIRIVMATAPSLFFFSSIQIGMHLALTLGVGKLLGFSQRDLLLASNANVGGKHWWSYFIAPCFIAVELCHKWYAKHVAAAYLPLMAKHVR